MSADRYELLAGKSKLTDASFARSHTGISVLICGFFFDPGTDASAF